MDRGIVYPDQLLADTDLLRGQKNAYIGLGRALAAILGTGTFFYGFAATPSAGQVSIAAGDLYVTQACDPTSYGSLGTDSTSITKQGRKTTATVLSTPAPGTAGQSINYLVQIGLSEVDDGSVVLPYYDSADPTVTYSGPGNSGAPSATSRSDRAVVSVKAGAAAATGSQTTPSPDSGYASAYVVTATNGASAPTVAAAFGAQFLTEGLNQKVSIPTGNLLWAPRVEVREGTLTLPASGSTVSSVHVDLTSNPFPNSINHITVTPLGNVNSTAGGMPIMGVRNRALNGFDVVGDTNTGQLTGSSRLLFDQTVLCTYRATGG